MCFSDLKWMPPPLTHPNFLDLRLFDRAQLATTAPVYLLALRGCQARYAGIARNECCGQSDEAELLFFYSFNVSFKQLLCPMPKLCTCRNTPVRTWQAHRPDLFDFSLRGRSQQNSSGYRRNYPHVETGHDASDGGKGSDE